MVWDSSALLAIILQEADRDVFAGKVRGAEILLIGAPTALEASMALFRAEGEDSFRIVRETLESFDTLIVNFTADHATAASEAFLRYGKGRHPAGLNLGDCMAYAIAKHSGYPLLFKGDDFSKTDITPA